MSEHPDPTLQTFTLEHLGVRATIELGQQDAVPVVVLETDPDIIGEHTGDRWANCGPLMRTYINDHKLRGLGPLGPDPASSRELIAPFMLKANGRLNWQDLPVSEDGELVVDDARDVTGHGITVTICTSSIDAVPVVWCDTLGDGDEFPCNDDGPICRIYVNDELLHDNAY